MTSAQRAQYISQRREKYELGRDGRADFGTVGHLVSMATDNERDRWFG